MREIANQVALVTGAASGIGRETALALAREGARLVVCDVNGPALAEVRDEIAGLSECLLAECIDVSDFERMRAFADRVHGIVPCVDILVNNAGVAMMGDILTTSIEDWRWLLGINLWGPIHGCHLFVPQMVAQGRGGHIVNVSSMLGFVSAPYSAAYVTSKFGAFGLALSLRDDLRAHGIGVSAVCPGFVDTAIIEGTRIRGIADEEKARSRVRQVLKKRGHSPGRVARAIVRAIRRDQAIVPVNLESRMAYYLNRLCPAAVPALFNRFSRRFREELPPLHPPTRSHTQ